MFFTKDSISYFVLQSSREQLAIAEFARSLLIIPKTLAVNAAQDATDLVAKLRAFHNSSQTKKEHAHLKWYGHYILKLSMNVKKDFKIPLVNTLMLNYRNASLYFLIF